MTLEDGIQVRFKPGRVYVPGDHWVISARTATSDVEWPGPVGQPETVPPHGVEHRFAQGEKGARGFWRAGQWDGPQLSDRTAAADHDQVFPGLNPVQQGAGVPLEPLQADGTHASRFADQPASNGLRVSTPRGAKSRTFRVTTTK